jgi:hypothetical protein
MRTLACLLAVAALGTLPGAARAKAPPPRSPVVVELFTAQGCASCRTANRLIARLAAWPGVIALTWTVDYWDYLGWKDTFAQPEFAARQRAFDHHLGARDVYTPQVIVNGAAQASGDDAAAVDGLIRKAEHPRRRPPRVRVLAGGLVRIGHGHPPGGRADVWLVRFDPREQDVPVTAGDNKGVSVVQRNIVREVVRLGGWRGHPVTFRPPAATEAGLATVVLVQAPRGGPIEAAEREGIVGR